MAQISIPRLPQAPQEYDPSQINSMINTIDLLIQVLNSSYTPEQLRAETEALVWFGVQMANVYKNAKIDLTDTDNETLYTVPAVTTAIVKSILVSEDAGATPNITVTLVNASAAVFSLFKSKALTANGTLELLSAPLVMEESEILKVEASTGNQLHVVMSILEIS